MIADTRHQLPQLSIDTSCLHGAQQQTSRTPLSVSIDGAGRRTDGRTDTRPLQRSCSAHYANNLSAVSQTPKACLWHGFGWKPRSLLWVRHWLILLWRSQYHATLVIPAVVRVSTHCHCHCHPADPNSSSSSSSGGGGVRTFRSIGSHLETGYAIHR